MFTNLKTVLYQKGISLRQYAQFLGVSEKTIQNKLNGITDFTYPEFRKTCILLLPEYNCGFSVFGSIKSASGLLTARQRKYETEERNLSRK